MFWTDFVSMFNVKHLQMDQEHQEVPKVDRERGQNQKTIFPSSSHFGYILTHENMLAEN